MCTTPTFSQRTVPCRIHYDVPRFPGRRRRHHAVARLALVGRNGFLVRLSFPGPRSSSWPPRGTLVAAPACGAARLDRCAALRTLIGINAVRFVGITFLVLAARVSSRPCSRPGPGGGHRHGGARARPRRAGEPRTALRRGLTHAWNAFGLLDLVVAVGTATAVTLRGTTPGITAVLSLPLVVIPTFFVPLFLASHVVIFRRLVARGSGKP